MKKKFKIINAKANEVSLCSKYNSGANKKTSFEIIKNENIKRKTSLDKKTVIAHQIYDKLKDKTIDESIFKKFHQSNVEYLRSNKRFNLLAQALIYLVLGIIELTKYGIIIYSVYLVNIGKMEVGTIILVYTYYDKIITNFEVLGTISAEYQSFLVSLKRINKLGENTSVEKEG